MSNIKLDTNKLNEKITELKSRRDEIKEILENIEAKANALWGLGDLERYMGNPHKALKLLREARIVLEKIGNVYAINQVEKIIGEIEVESIPPWEAVNLQHEF